jgi:hypothetical protein
MKFINKLFVNAGLFSVLTMLLLVPVLAITAMSFTSKSVENTEVLSAQDKKIIEKKELYNDVPVELEEIIRRVEMEMAKESTRSTTGNTLQIGQ